MTGPLYLSRLRLHPRDPLVVRDIGDVVELHRTLMRAFPDDHGAGARAAFGVLFRIESTLRPDRERAGQPHELLVQSIIEPAWAELPEGYALQAEVRDAGAVLAAATTGRRLRFRLLANATRKTAAAAEGRPAPRHSRRVPLDDDDERRRWLDRHAERSGFEVLGENGGAGVTVLPPFRQQRRAGVTVRPVLYDGLLAVRDPEAFRRALAAGIGPAKSYGCGLLSVAAA